MSYEIKDRQTVVSTTVWTLVKFDFLEEEINIPHFNPQSEGDILTGIENREITERNKQNETI